ncbi:MAG: NAD-dependent epimerase/dehydratase family protein, partial [Armatimonadota bacterium]
MSDRRIVLFGESGFIGSNLLRYWNLDNIIAPPIDQADLTKPDSLRRVLRPGDIVVNAAGYAEATDTSQHGRALFRAVNVDGVRNLAGACSDVGVGQLVHISSVAAMGRWRGSNITEEMIKPARSPYAQSKLDGERVLDAFREAFPVTIVRPTSVFGEGRGLAATLCKFVAKGTVPLPAGGAALIPFTYIGNVAHAIRLTLGNPNCFGKIFIVGDAESYPLRTVVSGLARAMNVNVRIVPIPASAAIFGAWCLERAARLRGSRPVID